MMDLRLLGPTGLRVSELCLGAMTFGTEWGWGADAEESRRMLDAFAAAGGNFVDTADAYTGGTSEELLGRFVERDRDRWVIATKYTISTDRTDPNAEGNGRKNLTRSLEASLRRLRTDYVDLYWVHMWDGVTPVEEVLRALDDAVRAGKVLHVGFSDFPAWLVARADALAAAAGLTRPAAIQIEYNLAARDAERELLPMAAALGLGVLDWSPLGGGALTGKHLDGRGGTLSRAGIGHFARYAEPRVDAIARTVVQLAGELGCSPAQLAIAWLRHRGPGHIPIVGARSVAHLEDNLRAAELVLGPEALARLEDASATALGWPHDFLRLGAPDWFAHAGRLAGRAA
jgi:aryl-alcohol dehydrogenase-like predicted oxidoreductase